MANQSNKPNKRKQLEGNEIDPSLQHIRELRGRSVNEESNVPPTGPNHKQSITDGFTNVTHNLPLPICQSTPRYRLPSISPI